MTQIIHTIFWFLYLLKLGYAANLFQQDIVDLTVEAIEECTEKPLWTLHLEFTKLNLTHQLIGGNLTLTKNFNDKMTVKAELQQWINNRWKPNAVKVEKRQACTSLNLILGQPWYEIQRECGLNPGRCPIQKGTYIVKKFGLDLGTSPIMKFVIGKYKLILSAREGSQLILCKAVSFVAKPI